MTVEVDLEDFETDELLELLCNRVQFNDDFDEDDVLATFKKMLTFGKSLTEASKIEYFLDNMSSITEDDLRSIVENLKV